MASSGEREPALSARQADAENGLQRTGSKTYAAMDSKTYALYRADHAVIAWPPLARSRQIYHYNKCLCIPMWVIIWVLPMLLAGFGFFMQNFQLRIGTYFYVHEMVEFELQRTFKHNANLTIGADDPHMTFGMTSHDVAFGSLEDPADGVLFSKYKKVSIGILDKMAAAFPFLFTVLVIAVDKPFIWAKIMFCFTILAVGKGFFSWITIVPDSNGWRVCEQRLEASAYNVDWYKQPRSVSELFFMDPRSRLCADMMWSGHTYFVAIFAFGLHELTRQALRLQKGWMRVLWETIVTLLAVSQQTVEIFFVLQSRFHYTADVVMALIMTYLVYTNVAISILAFKWIRIPSDEAEKLFGGVDVKNNKWVFESLLAQGVISLGCCCCSGSQQYIFNRQRLNTIMVNLKEATIDLDDANPLKMNCSTMNILRTRNGMLSRRSIVGEDGCQLWMDQLEECETDGEEAILFA